MSGKTWNRIACYLLVFLVAIMPWNGLSESEGFGEILSADCPARSEPGMKWGGNTAHC